MTQGLIYTVDGDGLKRMVPSAPESEEGMQTLVARYPELITDGDGDLLLIQRESEIGDGAIDSRWSLDHLFVTRDAVPVLVELKRATDTRLRREVVGQMLDYAANATAYWQAGRIESAFVQTVGVDQSDAVLAEFIGDRGSEEFWGQVDANLRAGRIKLVFVADRIPRELAVIVEFLDSQMRADVRAVELRWFSGDGGVTTLSPRVIGESERTASEKAGGRLPPMQPDEWIAERIARHGIETRKAVERFCAIATAEGGQVVVPTTRGSIIAQWPTRDGKHCYPVGAYPSGMVVLRLGYLKFRPAFASEAERQALYDRLVRIVGPLHTRSLAGDPGFRATLLLNDDIAERFRALLSEIVAAGSAA